LHVRQQDDANDNPDRNQTDGYLGGPMHFNVKRGFAAPPLKQKPRYERDTQQNEKCRHNSDRDKAAKNVDCIRRHGG
jgi:hypothetical protein